MNDNNNASYLTGKLLLAMPTLGDPRFASAVIYMCAHDDQGAMGLVINHEMPGVKFDHLLDQLGLTSDIEIDPRNIAVPVISGGPVESTRGFLLHDADFKQDDTVTIDDKFSITGTTDALRDILKGDGPDSVLFILGYAGWSAGQLEREIQENSWLVVDADPEIIFHGDLEGKWQMAVQKLGFDPAMLSGEAGSA